jgi:hypothetical protein
MAIPYLQLGKMRINGVTTKEMGRRDRDWLEEVRLIENF